ncbi:ABC-2 type transport system permease protein [Tumebacillus sp. BK434]|uniref:ABC transporter permease n=1 Tax=Tumebacillus sp. BK434 TaxID=2512169 RepID=UPI00104E3ECF|nr:ABC transporter permease [Tumebacillus sp. BK434]TCP58064.1 ABC-2 type transport system permease protein [Tumebacillus sp. BK434]
MNQILTLCLHEIKRVFKNRRSWLVMFLMPVLFTLIFGGLASEGASKIPLAVVDLDQSRLSGWVAQELAKDDSLDLQPMAAGAAEVALRKKKIAGILQFPAGYGAELAAGAKAELSFRHGPDLAVAKVIRLTAEDVSARAAVQVRAAKTWHRLGDGAEWEQRFDELTAAQASVPLITVAEKTVTQSGLAKRLDNKSERSIGFTIMFVMISLLSVTGTMLEARKTGVWYRLLAAPASRLQILSGYLLAFFLIGWIQFFVLMELSSQLFGVVWGDWLGQIVLVSALLLCVVGLGLFIAGLVKTQEQQGAIGTIVIISTCMLGGVYWPLDIVSDTMQKVANFVPQKWAMEGFAKLLAGGGTLADIGPQVGVLLAFGAVFLVAGLSRVKYE